MKLGMIFITGYSLLLLACNQSPAKTISETRSAVNLTLDQIQCLESTGAEPQDALVECLGKAITDPNLIALVVQLLGQKRAAQKQGFAWSKSLPRLPKDGGL